MLFSWIFWSKRGKLKNKGGIGHLVCVKRCYILEQPRRLHLRIARICLYVPLFSLFSFSMKRSEKMVPARSCNSCIVWIEMFTVRSYFPSYRLHVTRSGYAMTVSGPATSARLKLFVTKMWHNHRYESKRMNLPWFCSTYYESHWTEHPIEMAKQNLVRWRFTSDKFETWPGNGFAKQGTTVPYYVIILGSWVVGHKCWYSRDSEFMMGTKKYDKYWCLEVLLCINLGPWVIRLSWGPGLMSH